MANPLSGKSEATVLAAIQALLPTLTSCWGRPEAFVNQAAPVLGKELTALEGDMREFAASSYRQVVRLRNSQFRPFYQTGVLEQVYTRLVPTATDSPLRQGFLWLAFQAQHAAAEYAVSDEGKEMLKQLKYLVGENETIFAGLMGGEEDDRSLTLDKIERILYSMAEKIFGEGVPGMRPAALAGWLIEFSREEARSPRDTDLLSASDEHVTEDNRKILPLLEPVRRAELNEAFTRFVRMNEQQKARRFDQLRKTLRNDIKKVARYAPQGFERFCIAVEALLFPYPASIEWMRSYLKPIFTKAAQSSVFDNCVSEAAIAQRYDKLAEEKSANKVMLELSRAFALAKLNRLDTPDLVGFLSSLDLARTFSWPASLGELKQRLEADRKRQK